MREAMELLKRLDVNDSPAGKALLRLTLDKKLIHIDSLVLGNVKWKVSLVDNILII